jgi:hypothetical protein
MHLLFADRTTSIYDNTSRPLNWAFRTTLWRHSSPPRARTSSSCVSFFILLRQLLTSSTSADTHKRWKAGIFFWGAYIGWTAIAGTAAAVHVTLLGHIACWIQGWLAWQSYGLVGVLSLNYTLVYSKLSSTGKARAGAFRTLDGRKGQKGGLDAGGQLFSKGG